MTCTLVADKSAAYFMGKPIKCENFMKDTEVWDKILKLGGPTLQAMKEISNAAGASPKVIEGFEGAEKAAKITRDIGGMIAIFGGALHNIGANLIVITRLVKDLFSNTPVNLKDPTPPAARKFSEMAETSGEKWAALGAEIGKLIGNVSFAIAFGVCRPADNLRKYCHVDTKGCEKVGGAFGDVMLINHIAGMWASIFEIVFAYIACDREISRAPNQARVDQITEEYEAKTWKAVVNLVAKFFETLYHTLKKLELKKIIPAVPLVVALPMSLIIGVASLYSVWLRTV